MYSILKKVPNFLSPYIIYGSYSVGFFFCYTCVRGVLDLNFTTINALVDYVNTNLLNGSSMSSIERELGVGKDTIRKKLIRNNYKLDKELKQFVLHTNTGETLDKTNDVTLNNTMETHKVLPTNTNTTHSKRKGITQDNTPITQFTKEDIEILKLIIKNYKSLELEGIKLEGEIVTRSFRSYKEIMDKFVEYCKDNKLSQKDAFAEALILFMKR